MKHRYPIPVTTRQGQVRGFSACPDSSWNNGENVDALTKELDIPTEKSESVKPELEKLLAKPATPKDGTFEVIRDSEEFIEHVVASSGKPKPTSGVFQGVQS